MYLDFEDYHPSIEPVGRALTGLEVVLLTIVFHLSMIVLILVAPRLFPGLVSTESGDRAGGARSRRSARSSRDSCSCSRATT